jgi:hypothetical protein
MRSSLGMRDVVLLPPLHAPSSSSFELEEGAPKYFVKAWILGARRDEETE